jgi:hypothetical protein
MVILQLLQLTHSPANGSHTKIEFILGFHIRLIVICHTCPV